MAANWGISSVMYRPLGRRRPLRSISTRVRPMPDAVAVKVLTPRGDAPAGFGIQFGGDIRVYCHDIPSFREIMRLFGRFFQKKACLAGQKVVL